MVIFLEEENKTKKEAFSHQVRSFNNDPCSSIFRVDVCSSRLFYSLVHRTYPLRGYLDIVLSIDEVFVVKRLPRCLDSCISFSVSLQISLERIVFSLMNENLSQKRENDRDRRWVFKHEHVSQLITQR